MKIFLTTLLALGLVSTLVAAPAPIYENFGIIGADTNTVPQIDALAFANYGIFSVATTLPYDFQSTRFFTNRGTMLGSVGFQFDTAFTVGPHQPAESFINYAGAQISAS